MNAVVWAAAKDASDILCGHPHTCAAHTVHSKCCHEDVETSREREQLRGLDAIVGWFQAVVLNIRRPWFVISYVSGPTVPASLRAGDMVLVVLVTALTRHCAAGSLFAKAYTPARKQPPHLEVAAAAVYLAPATPHSQDLMLPAASGAAQPPRPDHAPPLAALAGVWSQQSSRRQTSCNSNHSQET